MSSQLQAQAKSDFVFSGRRAVSFRKALLRWYRANKRDLPWRRTKDPYKIWISEIMLQQTRVATVLEYYWRFLTHFPTVKVLAETPEEEVLASWSGLGYYRRARMMHAAAQEILSNHSRRFPCRSSELLQLPGIGRYTAAAIASIAFREPISLVDGNVARVLSRIAQMPQAKHSDYRNIAQQLLDVDHPGDFNQAMMELGATVCTPRAPKCSLCPVRSHCQTRGELSYAKSEQRNKQQIAYCFSVARGRILLEQRSPLQRLMPSMWELPLALYPDKGRTLLRVRHAITNTDYEVVVLRAGRPRVRSGQKWIPLKRLPELPLTGLARKILSRLRVNWGHRTSQLSSQIRMVAARRRKYASSCSR